MLAQVPNRATAPLLHRAHHPLFKVLIALLIVGALAALVAYLVVRFSHRRAPQLTQPPMMAMAGVPAADAALDQLRLRYARGEVSRTDYLQAAADLGAPPPPV